MDTPAWKMNESKHKKDALQHEKLKFLLWYAILTRPDTTPGPGGLSLMMKG